MGFRPLADMGLRSDGHGSEIFGSHTNPTPRAMQPKPLIRYERYLSDDPNSLQRVGGVWPLSLDPEHPPQPTVSPPERDRDPSTRSHLVLESKETRAVGSRGNEVPRTSAIARVREIPPAGSSARQRATTQKANLLGKEVARRPGFGGDDQRCR